jgi:PEP-CTERM motif
MTRMSRLVAGAGLCFVAVVPAAFADPVTVTSGVLIAPRPPLPGGSASLIGTRGFFLQSKVTTGEGRVDVLTNCDPCLPGAMLSIDGILSGSAFSGVATLDGNTYTNLSGIDGPTSIYMEFFGRSVMPELTDADVVVTLPFRMMGFFNLPGTQEVLRGRGLASVFLRPQIVTGTPPEWRAQRVLYDFSDQAAVPEPGTMILVGSGLFAVARRARRRQSQRPA